MLGRWIRPVFAIGEPSLLIGMQTTVLGGSLSPSARRMIRNSREYLAREMPEEPSAPVYQAAEWNCACGSAVARPCPAAPRTSSPLCPTACGPAWLQKDFGWIRDSGTELRDVTGHRAGEQLREGRGAAPGLVWALVPCVWHTRHSQRGLHGSATVWQPGAVILC